MKNLFANIPLALPEEITESLQIGRGARIERIVSLGHASPPEFWYDQPEDEWVLLVQGAARLRFEGEDAQAMKPGDYIHIPAGQRHRVDWTDPATPTIWLAIFDLGA